MGHFHSFILELIQTDLSVDTCTQFIFIYNMRVLLVALLAAISYAQTEFTLTIFVDNLQFAQNNQEDIANAIQTAFKLTSITQSATLTQLSTLDDKVLVIFTFSAPQQDVEEYIEPLSSSQRIARSSEEMDALGIVVTGISVRNSSSDKEWWEEVLDWIEDHWLELSIVGGALVVYCCILAIVCNKCYGNDHPSPPPGKLSIVVTNPYKNTIPKTTAKPVPSQTAPAKNPSPREDNNNNNDYVQIFENKPQPALQHEIEMEEFRQREKRFFEDDEDIMSEIEIGDRVEIWSKHVQNWIRADVMGMRDGKITVTYEIQGITYRKKVHSNDETAIRFRNSASEMSLNVMEIGFAKSFFSFVWGMVERQMDVSSTKWNGNKQAIQRAIVINV